MITAIIADDHDIVRRGLRGILESESNYRVVGEASDGLTAAQLVEKLKPHVLILDLNMPEYDGRQVVTQLRARTDTRGIPILVHTGVVLDDEERQRLAGHVQSITLKTDHQRLFATLEHLDSTPREALTT